MARQEVVIEQEYQRDEELMPEQALLQELVASAITACISYIEHGTIKCVPAKFVEIEYNLNKNFLKGIDESYLKSAGFKNIKKVQQAIERALQQTRQPQYCYA